MQFFVYILQSKKYNRFYIGQTKDVNNRLVYHNSGYSKSTKAGRPWELVYTQTFSTRSEAMKYENKLKMMKSKEYLIKIINSGERPD
jgi:putative endonuclease